MSLYYSSLPSVPSKPHPQLSKEWKHGWKPKSWVSLTLQDKTNNCDQNQNPQTIATKELGLKKISLESKNKWGCTTHIPDMHSLSIIAEKKEVKENNSCLMGPETRQSHTSQQNSQWELAGQCEQKNWRWKVYPLQPTSPGKMTRRSAITRIQCQETIRHGLKLGQGTEHRRTQIKEKGDKREISEQGSSFLGMSYWTDGSSAELFWHLRKTNWC